ncbi:MAG: hypothetical protein HRT46_01415 [Deltaproteobacteria bacterium]|nr:hypothetical protein [Deltaproteobacteria bacterium]
MKLRNIFVAVTVTLMAIAIAAPADAQLKCKAKQDKKTGAIGYSFVNKAGGTVVYSYSDLDPSPGRPHYTDWGSFANESTCQAGGKGRNCLVSNDAAEAAIAPSSCKIYMADLTSGDKCELYIKGCQVALRPPPTTGYYSIGLPDDLGVFGTNVCDADTGIAWYVSPDNQTRSLDDHETYLADVLNGGKSDGVDYACQTDGCDLKLPTLAQLQKLGEDCAAVAVQSGPGIGWSYACPNDRVRLCEVGVCEALWPSPDLGLPANCAWSSTRDVSDPAGVAYAVCVVSGFNNEGSEEVVVEITQGLSFAGHQWPSLYVVVLPYPRCLQK